MRSRFRVILGTSALAAPLLISGAISAASPAAADPLGLALSGNQFLLDGQPFVPHGFNSIALLNSPWCTMTATQAAAAALTPTELQLAKTSWNANTLRFQVSQPVLAGPNGVAYAQQIDATVQTVLSSGFVVDISMQDQSRACGPAEPLPGPETEAAWSTLMANTGLATDPDVMFELFNEPQNAPTSTATADPQQSTWLDWLDGGRQIGPGAGWDAYVPVGHQDLVDFLRTGLNVPNILIADGANKGGHLDGMPLLQDPGPTNQIAYAVHPYYYTDGQASWDTRWGYLAATNALIASEWNYTASSCGSAAQKMAPQLLSYLRSTVNIGVLGHALDDYPGSLVTDSSLAPTQCGTASPGGGQDFLRNYAATFVPAAVAAPVTTAAALGGREVDLSWTAPPDTAGIAGYDLYRDGSLLTSTPTTSYADTAIAPSTTYSYTVVATDTVGNVSPPSAAVAATTGTGLPPAAPTGLAATYGPNQIRLTWTAAKDPDGAVAGYDVYRGGVHIATTAATSYVDLPIKEATPYVYTVDAFDTASDVSPLSTPLAATAPDDQPPTSPTSVKATLAAKSITVAWAASTDNLAVTGYRVYRNGTAVTTTTARSYTDGAVTQGSGYQYRVVALDKAGNASAPSATPTIVFPDTTKPTVPTKLTLTPAKASIVLKWAASTDNVKVTTYRVYRSTTLIATVISPTLTYTNSGLKTGTSYSYHLIAI
ncbi:MAG TPA: cellulase family glycosylhydrolase, partial [Frankiaceae bacterium]|nr:cellulase family glycosylhydrolase [Frankiaceae bacterium]